MRVLPGPPGPRGPAGAAGGAGAAGAAGADGATWRSGAGAPDNGVGANGDFYFRTDTDQVYLRSAGTYSAVADLTGAAGAAGAAGATGPAGPTYEDAPGILVPPAGFTGTTATPTTNRLMASPFTPKVNITVATISVDVVVAGSGDTNGEVGIWRASDGALLRASGVISIDFDAVGVKVLSLTSGIALTAGTRYWVGACFSAVSGTPTLWVCNYGQGTTVSGRSIFATGPASQLWIIHTTSTPGSMPDPIAESGASTSSTVPVFALEA